MSVEDRLRPPGRPRNADTDGRVLAVARTLVSERGYPLVTMTLIATTAGVAKQTLYRRWPSKAEIVLEALLYSAAETDPLAYAGLAATLSMFLTGLFAHLDRDGAAIRSLIASAQSDRHFLEQFRDRFVKTRETALAAILSDAVAAGDLADDTDLAALSDMIHGAFWYRLLLGEPLDRSYADRLAATIARCPSEGRATAGSPADAPGQSDR